MGNTVSLCMIVKNEKSNIATLLDQVCPILEEINITDTGSTDGTLEILNNYAEKYKNLKIHHFTWIKDFSAARNYSFSKASPNIDWMYWMDGDDQLNPSDLKHFKDNILDDPNVDCWILDYVYSRFPDGSPRTILGRERFIRRSKNPTWINAIHETIDINSCRQRNYDKLKVVHNHAGKHIDINRNVEILESEYEKNPNEPRTAYYYGKELFERINPKGIEVLEHFVNDIPWKYWDDEINARHRLAMHYISQNKFGEAIRMVDPIYHLDGTRLRAEMYWVYGRVEQLLGNFKVALKWYARCIDEIPPSPRVMNLEYYTWNPLWRMSECYMSLGDSVNALINARKAQKYINTDPSIRNYIQEIHPKPVNGLKILEIDGKIRTDSLQISSNDLNGLFDEKYFDGVVIHKSDNYQEAIKILKPSGFLLSTKNPINDNSLNFLSETKYEGLTIYNHVKVDETKPSINFAQISNMDFGPTRIRLHQMSLSFKKLGYPVDKTTTPVFYLSTNIDGNWKHDQYLKNTIKMIDVCEWLPDKNFYVNRGIEFSDTVLASSSLLAKNLKEMFPEKNVVVIDDPFELNSNEWL